MINVLYLPVRNPEIPPAKQLVRVNNNYFPYIKDWKIYILLFPPLLKKDYNKYIKPISMYEEKEFKERVTKKDIEETEKWIGFSINTIIYIKDLYFNRKFNT